MDRKDQRVCIKFCVKNEKTESEIYDMLQKAYGKASLSRFIVYEWVRCFRKDRDLMKEDLWSGKQSASCSDANVDKIRHKIQEDRRLTVKELSDELGIAQESCQSILTVNLGLRRVAGKLVPRFLSDDQKTRRYEVCLELKRRADNDPLFLDSIITGDEMWIYGCDPDTKGSPHQYAWKSLSEPWARKLRQVRSNVRTLLIVFFDSQGIVHQEFVPQNQTVNQAYYKEVLIRLREKIRGKRAQMFRTTGWYLQQDNAPKHNALSIREFLASKKITVLPHPSYSPDLAPCDFLLFPKVKMFLKGKSFDDVGSMKKHTTVHLQSLTPQDFQSCFQKLQERWSKCIDARGDYFDQDKNAV